MCKSTASRSYIFICEGGSWCSVNIFSEPICGIVASDIFRHERFLLPISSDVLGWSWCILVFWAYHESSGILSSLTEQTFSLVDCLYFNQVVKNEFNYQEHRAIDRTVLTISSKVLLTGSDLCAKRDNFSCTDKEVGVQKQLGVLATLLKVLDPKLHQHIGIKHIYTLKQVVGVYLFSNILALPI